MLDVYKSCYKLKDEPFRLSPDHRFSFVHPSYANARAYLEYAISQGEGFIAITGEPGTGKTTLINGLLEELDRTRILVATLRNIHLDSDNLVKMVADAFDLRLNEKTKAACLLKLEQYLKAQIHKGRSAVLIVDEAQGLSSNSLEELRLLSNLQYDNRLLLQIFLVGQEEVMDIIHAPGMEHLLQRLIAASHLDRLKLDETVAYIEHRLCHAGWSGDPAISERALRLIYAFSEGVPRRINLICHRLFLYGGINKKHRLEGEDAQYVLGELQRERILAPDSSLEEITTAADDEVSDGSDVSDLGLPRAKSCFQLEQEEKPTTQTPSNEALNEDVLEESAVQTGSGRDSVPTMEKYPDVTEPTRPIPYPDTEAFEDQAGEPVTGGRGWILVVLLALLAGAILAAPIATDLREQLAGLFSVPLDRIARDSDSALPEPDSKFKQLPVSTNREVVRKPEQMPVVRTDPAADFPPSRISESGQGEGISHEIPAEENLQSYPLIQPSTGNGLTPEKRESPRTLKQQAVADPLPDPEIRADFRASETAIVSEQAAGLERLRLRQEAQQRFSKRLEHDGLTGKSAGSPVSPVLEAGTTSVQLADTSSSGVDTVKTSILAGSWVSQGQPATLLPSSITNCVSDGEKISCWSIPRTVDTKLGLALYKTEATIQSISTGNTFQLSYRTLIKLTESKEHVNAKSDDEGWQVTEHVLNCRLVQRDWVQCNDAKGTVRDYRRTASSDKVGVADRFGWIRAKTPA